MSDHAVFTVSLCEPWPCRFYVNMFRCRPRPCPFFLCHSMWELLGKLCFCSQIGIQWCVQHPPTPPPSLSFCHHHRCVELSQARHLTDRQMETVDFSSTTPPLPLTATWLQNADAHERAAFKTRRSRLLDGESGKKRKEKKESDQNQETVADTDWSRRFNQEESELHEWISNYCQIVILSQKKSIGQLPSCCNSWTDNNVSGSEMRFRMSWPSSKQTVASYKSHQTPLSSLFPPSFPISPQG